MCNADYHKLDFGFNNFLLVSKFNLYLLYVVLYKRGIKPR